MPSPQSFYFLTGASHDWLVRDKLRAKSPSLCSLPGVARRRGGGICCLCKYPPPQDETNKPPPCDDISYSVPFAWLCWVLPRLALRAMLMNSCSGWIRPQHPPFEEEPAWIWMVVLQHSTRSLGNSRSSVWYIDVWIHTVAHKVRFLFIPSCKQK